MILIKNLVLVIIKLLILLLIASFEKVIGLPMIFITLLLVFFVYEKSNYKYVYLALGSIFLAVTYGLSFSLSIIILTFLVLAVSYGGSIISSDVNRVLLFIYGSVAAVAMYSRVVWESRVVGYLIISSLVMIFILMKTLFSKHGLTGRISGKKSNFFR